MCDCSNEPIFKFVFNTSSLSFFEIPNLILSFVSISRHIYLHRLAAVLLKTLPSTVFNLGQNLDSNQAVLALQAVTIPSYQATATAETLDYVTNHILITAAGRRSNAQPVVIVMLGSESQNTQTEIQQSAASLQATGADVIVIGTNNSATLSLEMSIIASSPQNIYTLDQIQNMLGNKTAFETEFLSNWICVQATPTPLPTPTSTLPIPSSSTTLLQSTIRVSGSSIIAPTPTPTPVPFPSLTYCSQFLPTDVIVIISASGQTGADVFYQFTNLAATLATNLIDGNGIVR